MKKLVKTLYWVLIPAAIIMISLNLFAVPVSDGSSFEFRNNDRVSGTLDFQVRTTTHNGEYAPENCFAVWICDENDNFIRTLVRKAWSYRQHLVKWNQMTGGNYQNSLPYPLTGASYNSHVTTNVSWDLTDIDNQTLLPDGNYRVYVEFTENNSQGPTADGPWIMYEFTKGPNAQSQFPADTQYFHDVELIFNPLTDVDDEELQITNYDLRNYPNPFNPSTTIYYNVSRKDAKDAKIEIFNSKGQKVKTSSGILSGVEGSITWNGNDDNGNAVSSGTYFAKLIVDNEVKASTKLVMIK